MISAGIDPQLVSKQADTQELVRFKQEMDGLKGRLAGDAADTPKQLRKACENFEAVFISQLWKEMRSTVPKEGYLHSKQEEQYMGMFDRDFAEKMSQDGGIGLADMLYDQLSQKLKDTSKDALSGGVQIKPLAVQPIALNQDTTGIALEVDKPGMTLEDWGGADNAAVRSMDVIATEDTDSSSTAWDSSQSSMSDVDVKAQLEALTRRLEAERITSGLIGTRSVSKARGYGQNSEASTGAQVGSKIASRG